MLRDLLFVNKVLSHYTIKLSLIINFPIVSVEQCPEIGKNIKGGKLDVSDPTSSHGHKGSHYLPNTNISLTCGWFYSGGGSITCGVNETWSGPLPHCVSSEKYSQYTQ